jgi:hypothetical protein
MGDFLSVFYSSALICKGDMLLNFLPQGLHLSAKGACNRVEKREGKVDMP